VTSIVSTYYYFHGMELLSKIAINGALWLVLGKQQDFWKQNDHTTTKWAFLVLQTLLNT
jgi:hypothetical protein